MIKYRCPEIRIFIRIDTGHDADIFRRLILKYLHRIINGYNTDHTVFMIYDRQRDQTIFCNDIGNVFLIICRTGIQHIRIHDLFNRLGFTAGQQFFYVNLPDQMTLFCHITGINRLPVETNLSYF